MEDYDKTRALTNWYSVTYGQMISDILFRNPKLNIDDIPKEKCAICQFDFEEKDADIVLLSKCEGHFFHASCIDCARQGGEFIICPVCKIPYGVEKGNMPSGTMNVKYKNHSRLDGFPGVGVIEITYEFKNQNANGHYIAGIKRTAYLPDSREGNEVLSMLVEAFERRLTFKIGTSITTGMENCIVWSGIHHKTSRSGGVVAHGYPDPTYLKRVKEELNSKGIF
ncbi:unnamed protein product [Blepharisma stoltei]|uniref:RING-type E3 ubiquitin transferase n=1 Tax=Blepharisma stoltei TaxID=1481888 RepID=A0AAU9K1Q5_9CILI|nr:unnamed protein product [Blepharisma stoltei]